MTREQHLMLDREDETKAPPNREAIDQKHVRYMACHLRWLNFHKGRHDLITPEIAKIGDQSLDILNRLPGGVVARGFLEVLNSGLSQGRPMTLHQWQSVLDAAERP